MNEIKYARDILLEGFDYESGKCRVQPWSFQTPDGKHHIYYNNLMINGADIFLGNDVITSVDDGKTFGEPTPFEGIPDVYDNGIRTYHYLKPFYHKQSDTNYVLGWTTKYIWDEHPRIIDEGEMIVGSFDSVDFKFVKCEKLDLPQLENYKGTFMEPIEDDDGTVLAPVYVKKNGTQKYYATVMRFRIENGMPIFVECGKLLENKMAARGICEPRIAKLGNKYYMTMRTDEIGYFAESDDGLNYSKPQVWRWDDGEELTSRNTQQAWVSFPDKLFLVYTRETPQNHHIFRRRAPLFMAEFDPDRKCLIKDTEIIAVPEMGARLGNFSVTKISDDESWIFVCEWMQTIAPDHNNSRICESYGAKNRLWRTRVMR